MILLCQPSPAAPPPVPDPQVQDDFFQAMLANDTNTALQLLSANTNLARVPYYSTKYPLLVATSQGHLEIVELLLKLGADVNAEGDTWNSSNKRLTALDVAIWYNRPAVCQRLLAARPDLNHLSPWDGSALHMAFTSQRDEMAGWLLDQGADPFLVGGNPSRKTTPFELAITQGDGKLVPRMLADPRLRERAAQFLATNGPGLLTAAALRGQVEAVDALLQAGVSSKQSTADGRTLLQAVALASTTAPRTPNYSAERWLQTRDRLQKSGAEYDVLAATGFGDLETARRLWSANQKLTGATDGYGDTPLHWAVRTDRLPLTAFWLEAGVATTATNGAGQTALHLAAAQGLAEHGTRLLAARSPTDTRDTNGWTPLNAAIQAKQPATIRLLLNTNQASATTARGIAISLHEAAASGNIVVLAALVNTTNIDARNELGFTPFHLAMQNGQLGAAALLLDRGADANARDPDGNSALHLILQHRPPAIQTRPPAGWLTRMHSDPRKEVYVRYLRSENEDAMEWPVPNAAAFLLAAEVDAAVTNHAGNTAVQIALRETTIIFEEERAAFLKLLGAGGSQNLETRDENGDTPLHIAARDIDGEKVAALIAGGGSLSARNNLGRTPLHAAVEVLGSWGESQPFQEILKAQPDVNAQDNAGLTPLLVLALSESSFLAEATQALLRAGANPNLRDQQGRTAIHRILSGGWPWSQAGECIGLLLAAGADPSPTDDREQTPLHYLAALGDSSPMFFLHLPTNFLNSPKLDLQARDRLGDSPLHIAARRPTKDVFDWLVQHGANLDAPNKAGETPRRLAARNQDPLSLFRFNPETDIFQAVRKGQLDSVAALLQTDRQLLKRTDPMGQTPLRIAVMLRRTNVLDLLEAHGAPWDAVSAVIAGRPETLRKILAAQPASKTNSAYGKGLLHMAAANGDATAVVILLAAGSNRQAGDRWGLSPLGNALLRQRTNVTSILRQQGAAENIFDAVYANQPETLRTLLAEQPTHAVITNAARLSLPEIATMMGNVECLKLLLDRGTPVGAANVQDGQTLLHQAAIWNRTNTAKLLLQRSAKVDAFDYYGFTPLQWAASLGSAEVAALLLKSNANPNTVVIPAVRLSPPSPRMMFIGYQLVGCSALHLAAKNWQTNLIPLLLHAGVSVNATNSDGATPLDLTSTPPSLDTSFMRPSFVRNSEPFGPLELAQSTAIEPPRERLAAAASLLEAAGGQRGRALRSVPDPR